MTQVADPYQSLIEKAYIDPIRSVVVVDDDFPTLDVLLDSVNHLEVSNDIENSFGNLTGQPNGNRTDLSFRFAGQKLEVQRAAALIRACRNRAKPWMVDIHDGSAAAGMDELLLAPSLHHTDLMILDFHLNGDGGDGGRAIEILRALAKNSQFNLVVVYTKGISGSLSDVFRQIVVGLLYVGWDNGLPKSKLDQIQEKLHEWQDEDGEDPFQLLLELVSVDTYLKHRANENPYEELQAVFDDLLQRCPAQLRAAPLVYVAGDAESSDSLSAKDLFDFAVFLRHKELQPQLSTTSFGRPRFAFSEQNNWLRLDQLFLTVVKKDAQPAELVDRLTAALSDWAPGPHQLLMTKMRGELGERGVLAEAEVLSNQSLQAGWLHQLMTDNDIPAVMALSIERHWEALGDGLHGKVAPYATELFSYFREKDPSEVFSKYLEGQTDESERLAHLNHYYSAKSISSDHLTTGQILAIETEANSGTVEHWICLSPACDMVPGQKRSGWKSRLGETMPFLAVQLHAVRDLREALKNINQNRYLFLTTSDKIVALQFTADAKANPVCEQMFALNGGKLSPGGAGKNSFTATLNRIAVPSAKGNESAQSEASQIKPEPRLEILAVTAHVAGQLRYEYALNLLQRLGSSLSRVGLDFRAI